MQFTSINYPVFSLTLSALFLFGLIYAYIVNRLAKAGVQGQTAYTVVVGVGVTVLAAGWLIGWVNVILLLACFAASGAPMIVEYVLRTHKEQKRDQQNAQAVAKDLLG
jgi:putative flippase GtrA